jgi:anti-anti-sigma factor
MKFTVDRLNELAIFSLHEARLDSTIAPALKAQLLALFKSDVQFLILDLTETTFCDSSGLSAMLLAERQLREVDGGVLVVDPNGKIKSLLQIANLESIIPVFDTLDDAKSAIEE